MTGKNNKKETAGSAGKFLEANIRLINIGLAACGMAVVFAYIHCGDSCLYVAGTVAGVDLKHLGIIFMAAIVFLNLIRQDDLNFFLIAFAAGTELFLIGYQIKNSTYCSFCLLFAAIILVLFFLNIGRANKRLLLAAPLLGLIFIFVWFKGAPLPSTMPADVMTSFGQGKTEVRVYTDYFCGPCSSIEPRLESLISGLMAKGLIRVTFVDTPVHRQTVIYAGYFLHVINANRDFHGAMRARAVLFKAAKANITESDRLEEYLKSNGIQFKQFDTKPVFATFSGYLSEDGVNSTPTVVIRDGKEKRIFRGTVDILKAVESLAKQG